MNIIKNIQCPLLEQFISKQDVYDNIQIIDNGDIKIITNYQYSLIVTIVKFDESNQIQQAEELIQHQKQINSRLRYFGLIGIIVDIIEYNITQYEDKVCIVCKTLRLSEQKGQINLGLANCLHLYTGLELKGIQPHIIMHIDDLGMNKILPFTYLESVLNEQNNQLILYNDQLVCFNLLSQMSDIHILKYLELTSGIKKSDVLKRCKTIKEEDKIKYILFEKEIAIGDAEFKGNVEIEVLIRNKKYKIQAEWNNLKELINQRINGENYDLVPNNLFIPVDTSILNQTNIYEFDQRGSLIFLNCYIQGDLKQKKIIINKQIKKQMWFIALKTLLVILKINIQNVIYQDSKLFLRTLSKLNQSIPINSVEIDAELKEQDFNLILDQCNLNPHLESLILDGTIFKDKILSGLTQGSNLKSIKELSFKGCTNITDEGVSLLQSFGVIKLDLSYTNINLTLPFNLQILNIAYSKFKEETLLQIFRDKSMMNLISINISGLASDKLIQVIFSCHYKDLRVLIANDCKLSLSVFHFIHDSKHVKQLDLLSFQNSITDVEESIFKKNGYALLGASKTKLNKLDLTNCHINDKLVTQLVECAKLLSNLRVLNLSGCVFITDKSIQCLCDANSAFTGQLKSLDISHLPQITESSLEYLTDKPLKHLSDLNIAFSTQIQAEHIKKALDTGKFNHLKYLGISGTSENGSQTDIFKFNIPELCTYYIRNHLQEIQLIEIHTQSKYISTITTSVLNVLQSQILTKITTNDQIILEPETFDLFKNSTGCERLLLNNKPLLNEVNEKIQVQLTPNQFYEKLLNFPNNFIINNNEIKYIHLMYNFQQISKLNLKKTDVIDQDIEGICQNLILTDINIKKCKKLTFKSLTHLKKLSSSLMNIDFRSTMFETSYQTLEYLQYFPNLIYLNGGKLNIQIMNNQQSSNVIIQDLKHLPQLWMQLEQIKQFQIIIKAHYIQTFKFIFKTISLLLNKNQDFLKKLSIQLYQFKVIQDKSLQLFHNSLLNLQSLNRFHLGFQSMKNISLLTLRNMIISLSGLEQLRYLSISLDDCQIQNIDEDIFQVTTIFEELRNMKLLSFSFSSNDTITYEQQIYTSLFKYLADVDGLKQIYLSFQRHAILKESLSELFQTLKELNLQNLSLNFEQSGIRYNRNLWAELLEVLRMNYSLLTLELNFNHAFDLNDIDIHNIIEELYCMKLQKTCVQLIGCYHNEKSIKDFINEEVKNYHFFI